MKILIADAFSKDHLGKFEALGLTVDYQPTLDEKTLVGALAGVAILVVRSTKVTAQAIAEGKELALIVRAGAGTNTIDVKAASGSGIFVANCPGKNSVAVAELTMGLLLALDRRIPDQVADLRAGKWNKKEYSKAQGLKGRTLGLIGFGAIAKEVAKRARAFEMNVFAYSRSLTEAVAKEHDVLRAPSVEALCDLVEIVSVHVPLNAQTKGLVNEALLARMKGGLFINTSRAEVVDSAALARAVEAGDLRVATDVFAEEPATGTGAFADSLGKHAAVYGTHHVGASTEEAQGAIADETLRIVGRFVECGEVLCSVNVPARSSAEAQLLVRHLDRVGVLAEVLGTLRRHGINVAEVQNTIFETHGAACARIQVEGVPSAEIVAELSKSSEHILHVTLVER